jgi:hypothetical protein
VDAVVIVAEARKAALTPRTLKRAKKRLGVVSKLLGYGSNGRWQWRLPGPDDG